MIEEQKQRPDTSEHLEETLQSSEKLHSANSAQGETNSELQPNSEATSQVSSPTQTIQPENNKAAEPESPVQTQSQADLEALQQQIAALKEQLQQQTQEKDAVKSQYMRIAADFDNFRKRTLKEKEDLEYQVKRNTINELLPVVDNFERARNQLKPNSDGEMAIHKSYQGVYKNLVDSLKRLGVAAMRPEGEPFDPNYHEAMLREQTDRYPEGTIIEQLVRGYLLGEQVLRHAMVKVAATPEGVVTSEEETSPEPTQTNNAES